MNPFNADGMRKYHDFLRNIMRSGHSANVLLTRLRDHDRYKQNLRLREVIRKYAIGNHLNGHEQERLDAMLSIIDEEIQREDAHDD